MSLESQILQPSQVSRRNVRILALVALFVLLIVAGLAGYYFSVRSTYPWLFKGAYAEYHGRIILLIIPIDVKVRLEVLDFNSTHVRMLTYTKTELGGSTYESQNIGWLEIKRMYETFQVKGVNYKYVGSYKQEVYVEGLGTRKCIVYDYVSTEDPGDIFKIYVDTETYWIVKMTIRIKGIILNLNIKETNIPQLKK